MAHRDAAARTQRQVLAHPLVLDQEARKLIVRGHRLCVAIADRAAADLARRGEIALHQHRRDSEHVADIVEAVTGIVRRQHLAHVDIERQQIANGVGVFGAVEPMERRAVPGSGLICPTRSRSAIMDAISRSYVASSGRGAPRGGISRLRSLRRIFSQVSPWASRWARSSAGRFSFALARGPVWQLSQ